MSDAQFWVWLPTLVGLFAGVVLVLSSVDLHRFGAFPYWNGIVRLIFVVVVFTQDLAEQAAHGSRQQPWCRRAGRAGAGCLRQMLSRSTLGGRVMAGTEQRIGRF
jgi:hypothetical protein